MCKQTVQPINLPAIGERLWRALNLRGGINPDGLGSVVQADVMVADLTRPEYAWLGREKRYAGTGIASAVAAQNSQFELRNNAGSNTLVVVDQLELMPGANTGVGIFLSTVTNLGLAQSSRTQAQDARQEEAGVLSTPSPQALIFIGASVFAIPGSAWFYTGFANVRYQVPFGPIVLKPGTFLRIVAGTTNVSLEVNCSWRERPPTQSEL
ncbi:MAG TPA: hypothetical protein PLM62_17750 [Zoogloea sp.]|nr:hypothetical protein [Zoogloea sp.]